jgi:SAM-dependent methyltransferase
LLEFTGERVVPGLVDPNLFNEHLARYRFAARFARGALVLDAGCGSGYGTGELPEAAGVIAMDISADAVTHARHEFSRPGVHFLQGACESLPFADRSFDLVLAFEVIEHLERWQDLLTEARRVLRPAGILLVSTPNKAWYGESRAGAGANPYHVREFEYREFEAALGAVFPHVHLWNQNHSEAIVFVPATPTNGVLDAPADHAAESAHFFLAACSQSPIGETRAFGWLPSAGNVLRERQRHISLLDAEVAQKNQWLAEALNSHAQLQSVHDAVVTELRQHNAWAERLDGELAGARTVIGALQQELKVTQGGYQEQMARLEAEAVVRLDWIRDLEAQIARGHDEIARGHDEIDRLRQLYREQENTILQRTEWAQSLDKELLILRDELQNARAELQAIHDAKWVRLGRSLQLVSGKSE